MNPLDRLVGNAQIESDNDDSSDDAYASLGSDYDRYDQNYVKQRNDINQIANDLNSLSALLGVNFDVFSMGETSQKVCKRVQQLPNKVKSLKTGQLIVIDRRCDLITPLTVSEAPIEQVLLMDKAKQQQFELQQKLETNQGLDSHNESVFQGNVQIDLEGESQNYAMELDQILLNNNEFWGIFDKEQDENDFQQWENQESYNNHNIIQGSLFRATLSNFGHSQENFIESLLRCPNKFDLALKAHEWVSSIADQQDIRYKTLKNSLSNFNSSSSILMQETIDVYDQLIQQEGSLLSNKYLIQIIEPLLQLHQLYSNQENRNFVTLFNNLLIEQGKIIEGLAQDYIKNAYQILQLQIDSALDAFKIQDYDKFEELLDIFVLCFSFVQSIMVEKLQQELYENDNQDIIMSASQKMDTQSWRYDTKQKFQNQKKLTFYYQDVQFQEYKLKFALLNLAQYVKSQDYNGNFTQLLVNKLSIQNQTDLFLYALENFEVVKSPEQIQQEIQAMHQQFQLQEQVLDDQNSQGWDDFNNDLNEADDANYGNSNIESLPNENKNRDTNIKSAQLQQINNNLQFQQQDQQNYKLQQQSENQLQEDQKPQNKRKGLGIVKKVSNDNSKPKNNKQSGNQKILQEKAPAKIMKKQINDNQDIDWNDQSWDNNDNQTSKNDKKVSKKLQQQPQVQVQPVQNKEQESQKNSKNLKQPMSKHLPVNSDQDESFSGWASDDDELNSQQEETGQNLPSSQKQIQVPYRANINQQSKQATNNLDVIQDKNLKQPLPSSHGKNQVPSQFYKDTQNTQGQNVNQLNENKSQSSYYKQQAQSPTKLKTLDDKSKKQQTPTQKIKKIEQDLIQDYEDYSGWESDNEEQASHKNSHEIRINNLVDQDTDQSIQKLSDKQQQGNLDQDQNNFQGWESDNDEQILDEQTVSSQQAKSANQQIDNNQSQQKSLQFGKDTQHQDSFEGWASDIDDNLQRNQLQETSQDPQQGFLQQLMPSHKFQQQQVEQPGQNEGNILEDNQVKEQENFSGWGSENDDLGIDNVSQDIQQQNKELQITPKSNTQIQKSPQYQQTSQDKGDFGDQGQSQEDFAGWDENYGGFADNQQDKKQYLPDQKSDSQVNNYQFQDDYQDDQGWDDQEFDNTFEDQIQQDINLDAQTSQMDSTPVQQIQQQNQQTNQPIFYNLDQEPQQNILSREIEQEAPLGNNLQSQGSFQGNSGWSDQDEDNNLVEEIQQDQTDQIQDQIYPQINNQENVFDNQAPPQQEAMPPQVQKDYVKDQQKPDDQQCDQGDLGGEQGWDDQWGEQEVNQKQENTSWQEQSTQPQQGIHILKNFQQEDPQASSHFQSPKVQDKLSQVEGTQSQSALQDQENLQVEQGWDEQGEEQTSHRSQDVSPKQTKYSDYIQNQQKKLLDQESEDQPQSQIDHGSEEGWDNQIQDDEFISQIDENKHDNKLDLQDNLQQSSLQDQLQRQTSKGKVANQGVQQNSQNQFDLNNQNNQQNQQEKQSVQNVQDDFWNDPEIQNDTDYNQNQQIQEPQLQVLQQNSKQGTYVDDQQITQDQQLEYGLDDENQNDVLDQQSEQRGYNIIQNPQQLNQSLQQPSESNQSTSSEISPQSQLFQKQEKQNMQLEQQLMLDNLQYNQSELQLPSENIQEQQLPLQQYQQVLESDQQPKNQVEGQQSQDNQFLDQAQQQAQEFFQQQETPNNYADFEQNQVEQGWDRDFEQQGWEAEEAEQESPGKTKPISRSLSPNNLQSPIFQKSPQTQQLHSKLQQTQQQTNMQDQGDSISPKQKKQLDDIAQSTKQLENQQLQEILWQNKTIQHDSKQNQEQDDHLSHDNDQQIWPQQNIDLALQQEAKQRQQQSEIKSPPFVQQSRDNQNQEQQNLTYQTMQQQQSPHTSESGPFNQVNRNLIHNYQQMENPQTDCDTFDNLINANQQQVSQLSDGNQSNNLDSKFEAGITSGLQSYQSLEKNFAQEYNQSPSQLDFQQQFERVFQNQHSLQNLRKSYSEQYTRVSSQSPEQQQKILQQQIQEEQQSIQKPQLQSEVSAGESFQDYFRSLSGEEVQRLSFQVQKYENELMRSDSIQKLKQTLSHQKTLDTPQHQGYLNSDENTEFSPNYLRMINQRQNADLSLTKDRMTLGLKSVKTGSREFFNDPQLRLSLLEKDAKGVSKGGYYLFQISDDAGIYTKDVPEVMHTGFLTEDIPEVVRMEGDLEDIYAQLERQNQFGIQQDEDYSSYFSQEYDASNLDVQHEKLLRSIHAQQEDSPIFDQPPQITDNTNRAESQRSLAKSAKQALAEPDKGNTAAAVNYDGEQSSEQGDEVQQQFKKNLKAVFEPEVKGTVKDENSSDKSKQYSNDSQIDHYAKKQFQNNSDMKDDDGYEMNQGFMNLMRLMQKGNQPNQEQQQQNEVTQRELIDILRKQGDIERQKEEYGTYQLDNLKAQGFDLQKTWDFNFRQSIEDMWKCTSESPNDKQLPSDAILNTKQKNISINTQHLKELQKQINQSGSQNDIPPDTEQQLKNQELQPQEDIPEELYYNQDRDQYVNDNHLVDQESQLQHMEKQQLLVSQDQEDTYDKQLQNQVLQMAKQVQAEMEQSQREDTLSQQRDISNNYIDIQASPKGPFESILPIDEFQEKFQRNQQQLDKAQNQQDQDTQMVLKKQQIDDQSTQLKNSNTLQQQGESYKSAEGWEAQESQVDDQDYLNLQSQISQGDQGIQKQVSLQKADKNIDLESNVQEPISQEVPESKQQNFNSQSPVYYQNETDKYTNTPDSLSKTQNYDIIQDPLNNSQNVIYVKSPKISKKGVIENARQSNDFMQNATVIGEVPQDRMQSGLGFQLEADTQGDDMASEEGWDDENENADVENNINQSSYDLQNPITQLPNQFANQVEIGSVNNNDLIQHNQSIKQESEGGWDNYEDTNVIRQLSSGLISPQSQSPSQGQQQDVQQLLLSQASKNQGNLDNKNTNIVQDNIQNYENQEPQQLQHQISNQIESEGGWDNYDDFNVSRQISLNQQQSQVESPKVSIQQIPKPEDTRNQAHQNQIQQDPFSDLKQTSNDNQSQQLKHQQSDLIESEGGWDNYDDLNLSKQVSLDQKSQSIQSPKLDTQQINTAHNMQKQLPNYNEVDAKLISDSQQSTDVEYQQSEKLKPQVVHQPQQQLDNNQNIQMQQDQNQWQFNQLQPQLSNQVESEGGWDDYDDLEGSFTFSDQQALGEGYENTASSSQFDKDSINTDWYKREVLDPIQSQQNQQQQESSSFPNQQYLEEKVNQVQQIVQSPILDQLFANIFDKRFNTLYESSFFSKDLPQVLQQSKQRQSSEVYPLLKSLIFRILNDLDISDLNEQQKQSVGQILGNTINFGLKLGGFQQQNRQREKMKSNKNYELTVLYVVGGITINEIREVLTEMDRSLIGFQSPKNQKQIILGSTALIDTFDFQNTLMFDNLDMNN